MGQPLCSQEEFIAVWRELQSPTLVAKHLNTTIRAVQGRRNRLQKMHNILLPIMKQKYTPPSTVKAGIDYSGAVAKYEIADGQVLIGSDFHIWPGVRTTMQRAFIWYADTYKPKAIV